MTLSKSFLALVCVNAVLFPLKTQAFAFPPPTECISLPNETLGFDQVNEEHLKAWIPSLRYVINTQDLSIDTSTEGKPALRQRFIPSPLGSVRVSAASNIEPSKTYELSQSIFFEPGFDWGGIRETGKIGFGLGGGSSPSGGSTETDGFTARLIWEGNNDGTAKFGAYLYSADRSHNLPYGDVFLVDDFEIPTGEWLDVTLVVTMNSSLEEADGSLAIMIDDEVRLERDGILWQSSGELPMIDRLSLASFYGGGTSDWSPEFTTFAKIRNVCYSKH